VRLSECRFHGSYEAVYGGWAGNAFTALTGGISEKMKTLTTDDDDEPVVSADQLYRRLHNALASGAFVTATARLPTPRTGAQVYQRSCYSQLTLHARRHSTRRRVGRCELAVSGCQQLLISLYSHAPPISDVISYVIGHSQANWVASEHTTLCSLWL